MIWDGGGGGEAAEFRGSGTWGKCVPDVSLGKMCTDWWVLWTKKKKKTPKKMLPIVLVRDLVRTVVAIKSSTTGAATQTLHREGS